MTKNYSTRVFTPQFFPSVMVFPSYPKFFRSRTLPGSVAAARRLRCRAASCPATLWLPVWHLTHTRPAVSPTFWACRVLGVTWDRLTWAACSGGLACQQPSMRTISTWTLTGRPPVSLHCAWRPKSTVQPYLGQHESMVPAGLGALLSPESSRWFGSELKKLPKATVTTFVNVAVT